MFALDANTIIHVFQGRGQAATRLAAVPPDLIAIPSVSLYEVEQAVLRGRNSLRRRNQLDQLVRLCRVLPLDQRTALAAARLMADLERRGSKIGALDTLVAATALANEATLITHNTREFVSVPGLKIEDWFD